MGVFGFPLILSPGLPQLLVGAPVRLPSQPSESASLSPGPVEVPSYLAVSESVSPSHGSPEAPSQLARVSYPSQPAEMVVLVGVLLSPPHVSAFGRQVCRCARIPQGGRATRKL